MAADTTAPTFKELVADLKTVRTKSAGRIRDLPLPALRRACIITDLADAVTGEPAPVIALLRNACDLLGGGTLQEAAEYTLGLVEGTMLWTVAARHKEAADRVGMTPDSFRKKPQDETLGQVAEAILRLCDDARLRRGRIEMEQRRHPADSRLAVQWVERFEAYNRMWTPAYALAADLEAALETYVEEPAPHPPWDPTLDEPYDPILQARGYARSALFRFAQFELELKRFMSKHGGMWLLSDADVEQEAADTVYKITWHNNLNDEDESFLRRLLADSRHEEAEHFSSVLLGLKQGVEIHDKWQYLVKKGVGLADADKAVSQVWMTIAACSRYCEIIENDWLKIADWYRPNARPDRGLSGKELFGLVTREE
ncbi:hypothetical protein [Agreia sp. VKM Ac-1783]|uniref:hypothetical protein n=1 Tax=Agreia sp. VKM Ac-1783 TaxID=1938889 RepID=UPI000A2AC3C5|nr:hypothetical protein [Agreia sp. VKM Ac-1783]SMQ71889.1 hypothetical protein SAMN06295943_2776 [Agreia sp. VKM Ac-1783]